MFIVGNIIESIFWGVLIALLSTILVFVICLLINNNAHRSPIVLLMLGVYFVISTIIGSLMASAYYAKGYVEDLCDFTEQLTNTSTGIIRSAADFNVLKKTIVEEFPIAKPVIEKADFNELVSYINAGHTFSEYIFNQINEKINEYIHKCIYWFLFVTLIAVILSVMVLHHHRVQTTSGDISHYGFDNDTSAADYY